ncbi:SpoIID/LytB domain-containing protein [Konateibacter massiliensis]|uniref:SpoIID/LytB domain-containing protein n=1 Tax=Konateibacter massiliensis TaxID=2002841 RepID=UPI0015D4BE08|nr:SpoIID/LytB domain-containing protein [Konateibacter massiliensis]
MKHYGKNLIFVAVTILLLPYIVTTIFEGGVNFAKEETVQSSKSVLVNDNQVQLELDVEQYIIGVLASQISVTYEREAIKAQSVIARTSIIKKIGSRKSINTSELNLGYVNILQMEEHWGYKDFYVNYELLQEIVAETKGEIIEYEGQPIEAAFHAVSASATRSGEDALGSDKYPYLQSVSSQKDVESEEYFSVVSISFDKMSDLFQTEITNMPIVLEGDEQGYVKRIKINGEAMSGEQFRKTLSLPSACFEMKTENKGITFSVTGKGHGLGLSLYGANELAKQGKSYKEILKYYYQNIDIVRE